MKQNAKEVNIYWI